MQVPVAGLISITVAWTCGVVCASSGDRAGAHIDTAKIVARMCTKAVTGNRIWCRGGCCISPIETILRCLILRELDRNVENNGVY